MAQVTRSRALLLVTLVSYVAIVSLAAWRHEIRPAWLDPPVRWARALLGVAGIPPGVAVFSSDVASAPEAKITALCLTVRVVEADGGVRQLYPAPDAPCPRPAPRLWVRGEESALYRFATSLRSSVSAQRRGTLPAWRARYPRLAADSIAEHFRASARAAGWNAQRYVLLWTEARVAYGSGERTERTVALMRWDADPARPAFIAWQPEEARIRRDWPALGSP